MLAFGLAAYTFSAEASVDHILPKPRILELSGDTLVISGPKTVRLCDSTGCALLGDVFAENGFVMSGNASLVVNVSIVDTIAGTYDYELYGYDNEAYRLDIDKTGVSIKAVTHTGVIRGVQTLVQILEGLDNNSDVSIPMLSITDWPAFKLRGVMHDVGRSYIPVDELKKYIRLLSRFKINTFHWHLTENQAWRFEVKSHPELTAAATMTRLPGLYYTQEQARSLVEYARKFGVIVIPEIDMPGHSAAFERATGVDMQSPEGMAILKSVLAEVVDVFTDVPYIHIGGDEKAITNPGFLKEMTDIVHAYGKKVVCWNPIMGTSITDSSGFDMTQMWSTAGKLVSGLPNIDCRYNYTNHFDVFADPVGIFKSTIYYAQSGNPEIAGTISCTWNDRNLRSYTDIIRQNNFYANALASAERAWCGGGSQYIETGGTMLPVSGEEYDEFADWERRFLFHKSHSLASEPIPYVRQSNIRWRITDTFPNRGDVSAVFPPEDSLATEYLYNGRVYSTTEVAGAAVYLRHVWHPVVPSFFSEPCINTTAYAYTYVYSVDGGDAGALIEFQNYSRSEPDRAPERGCWDRKGSRIWLNGQELLPPEWINSGKDITNEEYLCDENFTGRQPVHVKLLRGWNTVLIKLPYIETPGIRLNKWMFTFVLTDMAGFNALDDIIYSPDMKL